jgi:hypothetical protein
MLQSDMVATAQLHFSKNMFLQLQPGGEVQRSIVGSIEGIDPGPLVQQHAHAVSMAIQRGQVQRRPPICAIPARSAKVAIAVRITARLKRQGMQC